MIRWIFNTCLMARIGWILLTFSWPSSPLGRGYHISIATTAMVTFSLSLMLMPFCIALTCPTSCSNISPLPYPFGAAPGCGSPSFQMVNCSISPPQWDQVLAGEIHTYYIKSIDSNPNFGNAETGPNPSYGDGGTVLVYLHASTSTPPTCEINGSEYNSLNKFATSNLYAFEDANLTYFQDHYFFFNCSVTNVIAPPQSGVLNFSTPLCRKYMDHCDLSNTTKSCMEYIADKELAIASLMINYNCTSLRRFIIPNEDMPISKWISLTQFAWGPVRDANNCRDCQSSGGTCGYNPDIQDKSFRCYCGNETYSTNCYKKNTGTLKGLGIGVSVVLFFLTLACLAFHFRYNFYRYFSTVEHLKLDDMNQAPIVFSYWALSAVTNSFSTKIGQGAFGKVYKGKLYDGIEIAVKVLDASLSHTDEQFSNEVATIGNIHHKNVARLVGFCLKKSNKILVYEYVSNGSLDKYLFSNKQAPVLSWKQRFDIALGIAKGLCYMHEECRNCIIHCDIKPHNILLDDAFCPKIADFGLARLLRREESRVLTHARGTPGYVAPEFWSLGSGPLSAKFDVYSYGMVLLEIIQGKRAFEELDLFPFETEESKANTFVSVSLDERIEHDADPEQVMVCTRVALLCTQEDPSVRPPMSKVVQFLLGTVPVPETPSKFLRLFSWMESSQQSESSRSGSCL